MGNKSIGLSSQVAQQSLVKSKTENFNTYFRDYSILNYDDWNQRNLKTVLRKLIILQNHNQLNQMYANFINIDRKPFNVLYPFKMAEWNGNNSSVISKISFQKLCTQSSIASVYFDHSITNGSTLLEYCLNTNKKPKTAPILKDNQYQLNGSSRKVNDKRLLGINNSVNNQQRILVQQGEIWFILNEISRSLQVLKTNKHAHWNITPETIFHNQNFNWFIHDSYYVIGPNHHNFLNYKIKLQKNISSPDLIKAINQGILIDNTFGIAEDIYCLGHTILFIMGFPWVTHQDPITRYKHSLNLLQNIDIKNRYSPDLIKLIKSMIHPEEIQRINIGRLRQKLKPNQKNIIGKSIKRHQKYNDEIEHSTSKKYHQRSSAQHRYNGIYQHISKPNSGNSNNIGRQNAIWGELRKNIKMEQTPPRIKNTQEAITEKRNYLTMRAVYPQIGIFEKKNGNSLQSRQRHYSPSIDYKSRGRQFNSFATQLHK